MGNCALWGCDPMTVLPLPTSSHTLPSAPRHSACHEKAIYVNPYYGPFQFLFRVHRLHGQSTVNSFCEDHFFCGKLFTEGSMENLH